MRTLMAQARRAAPGRPAQVWIDGLEVNARNAPEVRRRVGLVFQDPDDQLFQHFGGRGRGVRPAEPGD